MTSFRLASFTSALLLSTLAVACADTEPLPVGASADLTAAPGVALRGGDADRDLSVFVSFEMRTTGGSFKAALKTIHVARAGRAFDAHCSTSGRVDAAASVARLSCTAYTPSVDDRESLRFAVVESSGRYEVRDVALHGTKLADAQRILAGGHGAEAFPLDVSLASDDRRKNPFVAVRDANRVLGALVGRPIYSGRTQSLVPATAFDYSMSEYFDAMGSVEAGGDPHAGSFTFTMVEHRFDATSAFVSEAELAGRAAGALPQAPRCEEPAVRPTTPAELISSAVSPLGGPAFGRARAVTLAELPAKVRATLEREGRRIAGKTFTGTDYRASVFGYYAVVASCTDDTIVGYAVWGGGAGEPDYHDGTVVGVDLDGKIVSDESDEG